MILGLLALGLGALIRKTAGAITAVVGPSRRDLVPPVVNGRHPEVRSTCRTAPPRRSSPGTPAPAPVTTCCRPGWGLGVFFLYAAAALAAAFTLVRRDVT